MKINLMATAAVAALLAGGTALAQAPSGQRMAPTPLAPPSSTGPLSTAPTIDPGPAAPAPMASTTSPTYAPPTYPPTTRAAPGSASPSMAPASMAPTPLAPGSTAPAAMAAPDVPPGHTMPVQSRPGAPESSERARDSGTAFPPHSAAGTAGAPATRFAPDTALPAWYPPADATPVAVSRLVGQRVLDREGQEVGMVRDVALYPGTSLAVIASRGGERTFTIPLHYMTYGANGELTVNGSRSQLDGLPTYRTTMN